MYIELNVNDDFANSLDDRCSINGYALFPADENFSIKVIRTSRTAYYGYGIYADRDSCLKRWYSIYC